MTFTTSFRTTGLHYEVALQSNQLAKGRMYDFCLKPGPPLPSLPDTFCNRLVPGTHKGPSAPNPAPCHYISPVPPPRLVPTAPSPVVGRSPKCSGTGRCGVVWGPCGCQAQGKPKYVGERESLPRPPRVKRVGLPPEADAAVVRQLKLPLLSDERG